MWAFQSFQSKPPNNVFTQLQHCGYVRVRVILWVKKCFKIYQKHLAFICATLNENINKCIKGEKKLRCTTHDKKGPSPYYNPFLPYILIP
jgi:hypothetical protein